MKLRQISEGFWTLAPGDYSNSLVKSIPKAKDTGEGKPRRHSPLLHPDDRDRFVRWGHEEDQK
jgi:hypothetical protein